MAVASIQDRTSEFKSVLTQVQKRHTSSSKIGAQRQSLLTDSQKAAANKGVNGDLKPRRSEFARKAAEIGRGIGATMGKLEKLAQCMFRLQPPCYNWQLTIYNSGKTKNALRRPASRDQRVNFHNQARPVIPEPANLLLTIPFASPTSPGRPRGRA